MVYTLKDSVNSINNALYALQRWGAFMPSFMYLNRSICLVHLRNGEMQGCGDKQLWPPSQQEPAYLSLAVFIGLTILNLNLTSPRLECVDNAISTPTVVNLLHSACWGDKVSCPVL